MVVILPKKRENQYFTIKSKKGLTKGKILYEIAKIFPDDSDVLDYFFFEGLRITSVGKIGYVYEILLGS